MSQSVEVSVLLVTSPLMGSGHASHANWARFNLSPVVCCASLVEEDS